MKTRNQIIAIVFLSLFVIGLSVLLAQDVNKFFRTSDGEIVAILSLDKTQLSTTGTIKEIWWTSLNGETVHLKYDGEKLICNDTVIYESKKHR